MRIVILFLCLPLFCLSQVGINTTTPEARLEIRSSNQATPSNIDGILIPKIDEYPATNPTAAQDGMLVFATGNGSVTKGFYYWDNVTTTWIPFAGATIERIDDLVDGKSDNDGTNDGSSIFLGVNAGLNDDSTHNLNVGIGYGSMSNNSSGNNNTSVGGFSLYENTSGSENSAFGRSALGHNTTGIQNSALGLFSLFHNETGSHNVGVGRSALGANISGNNNVGIGNQSIYNISTGSNNIAIGSSAGRFTNGNRNVFIGNETGANGMDTKDGSVFIGYQAGYNESNSNRLYIENSSSSSPLIYGEFDNDLVRTNGDLEVVKTTNSTLKVKTNDGNSSSLSLLEGADYGFEFLYTGSDDKLNLWSRTFAGNEGQRMTWLKDGKVGINDTSPDARLDIEAINQATPNNTDGILIPRIDVFPATNPGANQNGMLVFLTSDNSFYFWRNSTTSWQKANVERINDLADGKSDNDGTDDGSSIFLGINAGTNDDGTDNQNIGIGFEALASNTSAGANLALGYRALASNSTAGVINMAIGNFSLESNTTGVGNIAVGYKALENNTNGNRNIAMGLYALRDNTGGDYNTAMGYGALANNTTANNNTGIGYEALVANTTGYENTAVGFEALKSNTSGFNNTALGYEALESNSTGYFNTALGYESLRNNTTGYHNTAVGYEALWSNTSGLYNSALGLEALESNTTGYSNTAIGYEALRDNTTGNSNTAVGYSTSSGNNYSNTTAIGYNADPNSSNQVRVGNAGVAIIGGYANWSLFSDRRLKRNIQDNVVGLEFIKKLRPVSYNYDMDAIARYENTPDSLRLRDAERLKSQEIQTGFIAQEVEAAANAAGFDFHGVVKPYDANGTYALRYAEFVVPLVKAMQEQQTIIEAQQEELTALRKEIEDIKALLKKE